MTDWFYILPLMVLGFCDAFGRAAEAPSSSEPPNNSIRDSFASKPNDHDSTIDGNGLKNRRFYWEPIFDGNVIGSIGNLFSDDIKDEADKERVEREKIREKELLDKYTTMLNDPKQLEELKRQSANSPNYINQIIRRSLPPSFDEPVQENVPRKSSLWNRLHSDERRRFQGNDHHRDDGHVPLETVTEKSEKPCGSQMLENSDIFGHENRRMPMDSSRHKNLLTFGNQRTNFEIPDFPLHHSDSNQCLLCLWLSLTSLLNDMDKKSWNLPQGINYDEIHHLINRFPFDNNSVEQRLRPSVRNLNRNTCHKDTKNILPQKYSSGSRILKKLF